MENKVHNLKAYKEAVAHLPHLDNMLLIINLSIRGLIPFRSYVPIAKILLVMEDQKQILESFQKKYKKIKDNKGNV